MKRTGRIWALLLAILMILTACSNSTPTGNGTEPDDGEGGVETTRDTIHLALNQAVETLNPFATASIVDIQLFCQIYETLFFVNDDGELEPRIAEKYEAEEDGMTYTVYLRDDIKFHSGKALTAEDVAWSLDYALKSGPYTQKRTNLTNFDSAEVIDDYTVQIKSTDQSANIFANICLFGYILDKDAFLTAEEAGTAGIEWVPYGTGPYVVTDYHPDAEINLQAFADYYRGKARIDKISYQI